MRIISVRQSCLMMICISTVAVLFPFAAFGQDTDGDGMPDSHELIYPCLLPGSADGALDFDVDGMTSLQEYQYSAALNPCDPDTDHDGFPDGWEFQYISCGFDPLVSMTVISKSPDVRITSVAGDSFNSSPVWTGSEYGVAWEDKRDGNDEIYFVRVSAAGVKIGSDLRITLDAGNGGNPSLAWTGSEFVLAWEDDRSGNFEIYFARVSAAGVKIGSDLRITYAYGDSANPVLAWTGTEFGLGWQDYRDFSGEIYFARLSAEGGKIGVDQRITSAVGDSGETTIAWSGSEFGLSWEDQRDGNGEIYFARVSAGGGKIGGDLRVTNGDLYSLYPSLAWSGSEFGVSWQDSQPGNWEIYFARISGGGGKIGGDLRISNAAGDSGFSSLAWNGLEFGVSWQDFRYGSSEIFFARISGVGVKLGSDLRVTSATGNSLYPSLSWSGSEYGVSWEDFRSPSNEEIYFARLNPNYTDQDGDGLHENHEFPIGANPCDPDSDNDGLTDLQEVNLGTHPLLWDTDYDTLPDGFEAANLSGHTAGMELNPLDSADGNTLDFDLDGITNAHDFWNAGGGSGAGGAGISGHGVYIADKAGWPACGYWGEGDGDGFISPMDIAIISLATNGYPNYSQVYPATGETQDLDTDGFLSPVDKSLLQSMVKSLVIATLGSRPAAIGRISPADGISPIAAIGDTINIIVSVINTSAKTTAGIPVVFTIDPSSTGAATILGGEGADTDFTRYDLSTGAASGGQSRVTLRLNTAGTVTVNAKVKQCGADGRGRYCDEVLLAEPVTITVSP